MISVFLESLFRVNCHKTYVINAYEMALGNFDEFGWSADDSRTSVVSDVEFPEQTASLQGSENQVFSVSLLWQKELYFAGQKKVPE